MPNKNYLKGVRAERALVNEAREQGHISFRSAGSHSPIDVCIIDRVNKKISFIQCKPDSMGIPARDRLRAELADLNDEFIVTFEVI